MRQGTIGDVAAELGVSTQRIEAIRRTHPDAPKPLRNGKAGRLYDLDRWRKWAAKRGLGRPKAG